MLVSAVQHPTVLASLRKASHVFLLLRNDEDASCKRRLSCPNPALTPPEPYCRAVSSHVTPKLPRLSGCPRRIVPRLDTMRVVMRGNAGGRHAKDDLGGIGGVGWPSWRKPAQSCMAVPSALPQGVAGSKNRDPSETAERSRFGRRSKSRMTCRVTSG